MTTAYKTKNDLPEAVRTKMIDLLNETLASSIDLSLQSKQAHWNVKGPSFFSLHELFDKVYGEATEWVDVVAERAVQLGGIANGTLPQVAKTTHLPPYKATLSTGPEHVEALSSALAAFGKIVRKAIDVSADADDADTADLFTEVSRGVDKMLWFVESHQQVMS